LVNNHGVKKDLEMTKEELIAKIQELLKTDLDLGYLMGLKKEELETLIARIRDRVDNLSEQ
jgi:hypothetical protein